MLLFLDICVFKLRHISPAWQGQMLVQDNPCSKHTQPLEQTALPYDDVDLLQLDVQE
jgi:hypothetical protein